MTHRDKKYLRLIVKAYYKSPEQSGEEETLRSLINVVCTRLNIDYNTVFKLVD